jgi:replicative DNA helicase
MNDFTNMSTEELYITINEKNLLSDIKSPNVQAVYIIDDFGLSEHIPENIHRYLTENIYQAFTRKESKFLQPVESANNPVIVLSNHAAEKPNFKAVKVINTLKAAGVKVYKQDINKPFKPITCHNLAEIKKEIVKQYQDNYSAGGCIEEFENVIESGANTPAIKTGFSILDNVLDGGLYEGVYALGAISSLGKTTFCLNIAEQIAAAGTDVIIIALEMSKYQLMSRSISRLTFCEHINNPDAIPAEWCKTSRGISDGSRYKNYSEGEKKLIKAARDYYAAKIGNHIFIHEAVGNLTASTIREIVSRHIEYTDNKPVVIVDYLQLVKNEDARINANDKTRTDYNLTELKQLSRDYKLPILLISSVNRGSYKEEIKFESFKESGGIDFGCDVIIGLQLAGVGTIDFNVNEAKAKNPREIEAVILKNREAPVGDIVKYFYYPMFNHFEESAEDVKAAREYDKEQAKAIKEKEKANRAELAKIEHNELIDAAFEACEVNGTALISGMVDYCGGKPTYRTFEKYIKESDKYNILGNKVTKKK